MRLNALLPATIWLSLFCVPCSACSGVALHSVDAGAGFQSMVEGQQFSGFEYILRDRENGQVLVCSSTRCYAAIGKGDNGQPVEAMKLSECVIAERSSDQAGLERHEITATIAEKSWSADDANKLVAAGVVLAAISNIAAPKIVVDDASHAHVSGNADTETSFLISKLGSCKFKLSRVLITAARYGAIREDTVDFSKLTGRRTWNSRFAELAITDHNAVSQYLYGKGTSTFKWLGLNFNSVSSPQRIFHNVDYLLNNGCGQSLIVDRRNPEDPY